MAVCICNPRTTSGDRQIHGAQWHVWPRVHEHTNYIQRHNAHAKKDKQDKFLKNKEVRQWNSS